MTEPAYFSMSESNDAPRRNSRTDSAKAKKPKTPSPSKNGTITTDDGFISVSEKYACGDTYEGFVMRHGTTQVKQGHGRYQFANGSVYEGDWHHGAMHGKGVFFEAETSDRFEGLWSFGRRVNGVYYFPNGDLFIGAFDVETGNRKHGRCVLVDDLVPYDAEYQNDEIVWKEPFRTAANATAGTRPGTAGSSGNANNGGRKQRASSATGVRVTQSKSASPSVAMMIESAERSGTARVYNQTAPSQPLDQLTAAKIVLRSTREKVQQGDLAAATSGPSVRCSAGVWRDSATCMSQRRTRRRHFVSTSSSKEIINLSKT